MLIVLSRFFYRHLVFLIFFCLTVFWIVWGLGFTERAFQTSSDKYEAILVDYEKKLEREDPLAASKLAKFREDQQINKLALATHLVRTESERGMRGITDMLSKQESLQGDSIYELAVLATSPDKQNSSEMKEKFLMAQASVVELLLKSENTALAHDYISRLNAAANDPETWAKVYDDAFGLIVLDRIQNPELQQYYLQERNSEWLEESMLSFVDRYGTDDDTLENSSTMLSDQKLELLTSFLECAKQHHPEFKKAVVELNLGVDVFPLFEQFGDVIDDCSKKYHIPLQETLDVIFANQDFVGEQLEQEGHERVAASLHLIRSEKPSAWREAQSSVMVLRMNHDVPNLVNQICEKFPGQDIPAFVYAAYEDEAIVAATAIAQYGDLAIYVLFRYSELERFHRLLSDPSVGVRAVVYIARFSDSGIDKLEENRAWLDKYFQPDGTPIEKEWWTSFPGGELANVARNWATGIPNEWGELGWAALDSAEGMLFVMSFGSSTLVTKPLSQTAKLAIKKQAKKQLLKNGKKVVAKQRNKSMLRQVSEMAAQPLKLAKTKVGTWVAKLAIVKIGQSVALQSLAAGKQILKTWKKVPLSTRRIVYRSLLAVGLVATLVYRTLPNLDKVVQAVVDYPANLVKEGFQSLANQIGKAIDSVNESRSNLGIFLQWVLYLVILAVLSFLAVITFPREGKLRYVR